MTDNISTTTFKGVRYWLYFCCAMIGTMAVIGAITRLTESGLSMTEWRPVTGWLPPLSEEAWLRQYELYKQSPEFLHKHNWMALEDFKGIFFWEWLHRLWGRTIGLVYTLPLLWFWLRKKLPAGYKPFFIAMLLLGGFQGVIGWWMVKSGLIDRPSVSHFRLATHLGVALVLFALLWGAALTLREVRPHLPQGLKTNKSFKIWAASGLTLLAVTITWGAFTAGMDAGLIYNTFPKMDTNWMPHAAFDISRIVADPGWIQFSHRWLAIITGLTLAGLAFKIMDWLLLGMIGVQISLGITALLMQVPVALGALHQAGAIILLALTVRAVLAVYHKQNQT